MAPTYSPRSTRPDPHTHLELAGESDLLDWLARRKCAQHRRSSAAAAACGGGGASGRVSNAPLLAFATVAPVAADMDHRACCKASGGDTNTAIPIASATQKKARRDSPAARSSGGSMRSSLMLQPCAIRHRESCAKKFASHSRKDSSLLQSANGRAVLGVAGSRKEREADSKMPSAK